MTPSGDNHVIGVGIDLVETERIQAVLDRWGETFLQRVFMPPEIAYCRGKACPARHFAGRFAVKEAVSKAFGTGFGERLAWRDVEVLRIPETGAPIVRLSERARHLANHQGGSQVLISLSHTRRYAAAQAILVGDGRTPESSL